MIKIEFTEEAIEKLRHERFHHPHPRVQRKMEALLLKSQRLPHKRIARILGVSENTLCPCPSAGVCLKELGVEHQSQLARLVRISLRSARRRSGTRERGT